MVSKKYVDDSLTDLETKTQNISLTNTDITKTVMTKQLQIGGGTSSPVQGRLGDQTVGAYSSYNSTHGWEFTPSTNITVTRFKISTLQWLTATSTKDMAIYRDSDQAIAPCEVRALRMACTATITPVISRAARKKPIRVSSSREKLNIG